MNCNMRKISNTHLNLLCSLSGSPRPRAAPCIVYSPCRIQGLTRSFSRRRASATVHHSCRCFSAISIVMAPITCVKHKNSTLADSASADFLQVSFCIWRGVRHLRRISKISISTPRLTTMHTYRIYTRMIAKDGQSTTMNGEAVR